MTVTVESSPSAGAVEDGVVTKPAGPDPSATGPVPSDLVEEDLLVEDVSIDGMCGVY